MRQGYRFLLIGGSPTDPWRHVLERASSTLGAIDYVNDLEALERIRQQEYDLIIVDTAQTDDTCALVSIIREVNPQAKIFMATTSPTWKRARAAFHAGVSDYVRKSMNVAQTHASLREMVEYPSSVVEPALRLVLSPRRKGRRSDLKEE